MARGNLSGWVCSAFTVKGFQAGFLGNPFPVQSQNAGAWAACLSRCVATQLPYRVILLGSLQPLLCLRIALAVLLCCGPGGGGEPTWGACWATSSLQGWKSSG